MLFHMLALDCGSEASRRPPIIGLLGQLHLETHLFIAGQYAVLAGQYVRLHDNVIVRVRIFIRRRGIIPTEHQPKAMALHFS